MNKIDGTTEQMQGRALLETYSPEELAQAYLRAEQNLAVTKSKAGKGTTQVSPVSILKSANAAAKKILAEN